jgi:Protein of unknown function (DUF2934)
LEVGEDDMAKRPTTRSKDTDAAAPAQPKPRRARGVTALPATPPPATAADASGPVIGHGEPTLDEIRQRAYERYLERGGRHGEHFDDWLQAEKELKSKK